MAVDFKKTLKHLYTPKTKPSIVNVEKANYIAVRGSGDPNDENSEYKKKLEEFKVLKKEIADKKKKEDKKWFNRSKLRGLAPKDLNFNKVYMKTHRRSGLLISKYAL